MRRLRDQAGMALLSVLVVMLVLALLGGLVIYLSGQESQLSTVRYRAAQSLNVAEGGAFAARAALMALLNADPQDAAQLTADLLTTASGWYAGGNPNAQNPFAFLDHLVIDGQRLSVGAGPSDAWVVFRVNWSRAEPHLKLEFVEKGPEGSEPSFSLDSFPANRLGEGEYRAAVILRRRAVAHSSCGGDGRCYVHQTGLPWMPAYTIPLTYEVISDGQVDPQFRRQVRLRGDFNVVLRNQSFAQWSLFTHVHLTPGCGAIWFTSRTSFDGPVHTNAGLDSNGDGCAGEEGEFRFAFFPKFGTPDVQSPCDEARILGTSVTSTSQYVWFNNRGNPVRLQMTNENKDPTGARIDAPVLPDCSPGDIGDDHDNRAAQLQLGYDADPSDPDRDPITVPPNSFNQKGVSIGRDPRDVSPVTNAQVRASIPELRDNSNSVPSGIYVPATDGDGDCITEDGDRLVGGIYVEGDLDSLTFRTAGPSNELAVYELRQGSRVVTITVDRNGGRTTIEDSNWPRPEGGCSGGGGGGGGGGRRTVTLQGVPNGVVFVEGNVGRADSTLGLSGTLEEKEQVTVVASGTVYVSGHLRYERAPNPYDPNDNPLNLLGVYTPSGDIRISRRAPADLVVHGVLMAGQPGVRDGRRSSVNVEDYDSISCRGAVHLLGGLIEEFYGAFGTFDSSTGACRSGYGRDFRFDRRMSRGFAPPYFPTTGIPRLAAEGLATVRPEWREGSP